MTFVLIEFINLCFPFSGSNSSPDSNIWHRYRTCSISCKEKVSSSIRHFNQRIACFCIDKYVN